MYLFMGLAMLIPLETVSNNFDYIGMNASVAKKIDEILKLDEMTDTTSKAELSDHTIVFEHVTFSYGEGQPVLKDVSFTVPDGKVTALAGVSGSGKSTAANLICRFWDITEGQIYLGGVPLNQIPLSELMSQISFVTQNTFLFKKSIRKNIMMGNPEATEEEMMQAAKDAVCHDFIMRLPKGYDTVVDKETKLSGGEKQRITLARAILKNAPIVILDEATAYIDADNEDLLQKALAKLSEGKTVLVIAHRLSSITKSIVDLMGDVITVDSTPGKGSRFEVLLEFPIDTTAERNMQHLSILLVQCTKISETRVRDAAQGKPIQIHSLSTVSEAVENLHFASYDVILTPLETTEADISQLRKVVGENAILLCGATSSTVNRSYLRMPMVLSRIPSSSPIWKQKSSVYRKASRRQTSRKMYRPCAV